jgi:hypothetical protein
MASDATQQRREPSRRAAWLRLIGAVGLVWAFAFLLAAWGQRLAPVAELHGFVEERGIDASALFYTESEAFDPVALTLHNSFRFGDGRAAEDSSAP